MFITRLLSGIVLVAILLATGIFYLAFNGILTIVFGKIEKKLDYYKT